MSQQYVDDAKARMGAIERLLKGLPGIRGYVDKELRRDADKRLRELIAGQLEDERATLFAVQNLLLEGKGLMWMDNVDSAITRLQLLIDRIKTASYGYAGLFDAVRIKEDALDALHRFDVAMAERVVDVRASITALHRAVRDSGDIGGEARRLIDLLGELNTLFGKRQDAILSPDLLDNPAYRPDAESGMLSPDA
jgi:hypothetical protein